MSVEQIRSTVERFVADDSNELLVIKGGWGAGKTYFWQNVIRKASNDQIMARRYYSYVSLFGINSLEEIKNSIFVSRLDTNDANFSGNKGLIDNAKQLAKDVEKIPFIRDWTGGLASTALFLLVKDCLICFDDFERKGESLDARDILGLASLLKEQRNCKVVFIMNDEALSGEQKDAFRRHSEKIIDLELAFSPLSEEAFSYVFSATDPYYDFTRSCCITLNITNIRTLQRIRRFITNLLGHLKHCEITTVEDTLRSLVLYIWCYFERNSDTPPLAHVMSYRYFGFLQFGSDASEDVKRWDNLLRSYEYHGTDEVGTYLAAFVQTGYLDENAFVTELRKKNEAAHIQQRRATYGRVWDLWKNSFDNNEQEFVQELEASFRSNMMHLSIHDLQTAVQVLPDLARDQLATNLIDDYFAEHIDQQEILQAERIPFIHNITDLYLIERLNSVRQTQRQRRTLSEVIEQLSSQNGWNQSDIDVLDSFNADDYYTFFKSLSSDLLYIYVKTCLRFGNIDHDEKCKSVGLKAKEALLRIASESRINQLRISVIYGVDAGRE